MASQELGTGGSIGRADIHSPPLRHSRVNFRLESRGQQVLVESGTKRMCHGVSRRKGVGRSSRVTRDAPPWVVPIRKLAARPIHKPIGNVREFLQVDLVRLEPMQGLEPVAVGDADPEAYSEPPTRSSGGNCPSEVCRALGVLHQVVAITLNLPGPCYTSIPSWYPSGGYGHAPWTTGAEKIPAHRAQGRHASDAGWRRRVGNRDRGGPGTRFGLSDRPRDGRVDSRLARW